MKELITMLPAAAGAALGIANAVNAGKKQVRQQGKLTEQQVGANKELAEHTRKLQMQTWNETNYEAQLKHMKEAGLNPGLMYGISGGGGATTGSASAGSAGGGQAANAAATQGMGIEAIMAAAQIELMKAQAEKTTAEAEKIKGVDTAQTQQSTIESQVRTELNKIDVELKGKSLEDQLQIIEYSREKLLGERDSAWAKGNIDQATIAENIKIVRQELTNKALEAVAINSGITLNEAKVNEISNGILQKWQELNINETKSRYEHQDRIKAIEEYTANALKVAGIQAVGHVVGDITKIATKQIPKGSTTKTTKWGNETTSETNYK